MLSADGRAVNRRQAAPTHLASHRAGVAHGHGAARLEVPAGVRVLWVWVRLHCSSSRPNCSLPAWAARVQGRSPALGPPARRAPLTAAAWTGCRGCSRRGRSRRRPPPRAPPRLRVVWGRQQCGGGSVGEARVRCGARGERRTARVCPSLPAHCAARGRGSPLALFCTVSTGTISPLKRPLACAGGGASMRVAAGRSAACTGPASQRERPPACALRAGSPYWQPILPSPARPTVASAAFWCERAAQRSCSSRDTPKRSATFSAVRPALGRCVGGWGAQERARHRGALPVRACLGPGPPASPHNPPTTDQQLTQGQGHVPRVLHLLHLWVVAALPLQRVCARQAGEEGAGC